MGSVDRKYFYTGIDERNRRIVRNQYIYCMENAHDGYSIRKRPGLFLNKSGRPRKRVRLSTVQVRRKGPREKWLAYRWRAYAAKAA